MAKVHWARTINTSMCGLNAEHYMNVEFAENAPDVTCERCRKLIPEIRRTAWDLLLQEDEAPKDQPEVPAPKPKKKPKPKVTKVTRENSKMANFGTAYFWEESVEDNPEPVILPGEIHLASEDSHNPVEDLHINTGMTRLDRTKAEPVKVRWWVLFALVLFFLTLEIIKWFHK